MAEQGRREGVTWLRGKPYTSWQVPHKHQSDQNRGTATYTRTVPTTGGKLNLRITSRMRAIGN